MMSHGRLLVFLVFDSHCAHLACCHTAADIQDNNVTVKRYWVQTNQERGGKMKAAYHFVKTLVGTLLQYTLTDLTVAKFAV